MTQTTPDDTELAVVLIPVSLVLRYVLRGLYSVTLNLKCAVCYRACEVVSLVSFSAKAERSARAFIRGRGMSSPLGRISGERETATGTTGISNEYVTCGVRE